MAERSSLAEELAKEQAHIDRAYAVLDAIREGADHASAVTLADDEAAGGTFQERFERERLTQDARRRADELRWGDPPLVFGRIDRADGERFHVGRVGVFDDAHDPLVVDWRAPVAEPFYRATRADPLGLRRRRSFHCRGRRLLGIDDDTFGTIDEDDGAVVGEAALLAALSSPRTGRMGAHVATVQAEQDEVIRAPMAGVTIVQGAAGTGKTVVALHRAAYLLYTYREVLDRQGVLILGPNPGFLDYVRDVLPSLGEHEARLATVEQLFPGVRPVRETDEAVASLKADLRMARVVARAVRTRQRGVRDTVRIPYGRFVLKLPPEQVTAIVDEVRGLRGTHNGRRRFVESDLVDALHDEFRRRNTATVDRMRDPGRSHIHHVLQATPAFRTLLQRVWPLLTPQALLHDLFGSAALIRAAGARLSEPERELLHRPRSADDEQVAWSDADVPLLHEAHALLGPLPRPPLASTEPTEDEQAIVDRVIYGVRASMELDMDPVMEADLRRSILDEVRADLGVADEGGAPGPDETATGRPPVWGSVLVDEAQDISPMAWRMIIRSCPNQAMTIVGDLAQGTRPWSPHSWDEVVEWIEPRHAPRRHELHVNYRTPREIMAWAAPFSAAPDRAEAIRSAGEHPRLVAADADGLVAMVASVVGDLLADAPEERIGLVVPEVMLDELRPAVAAGSGELDAQCSLHTPETVKGLEFDSVLVVEPGRLAGGTRGDAALYIALTRATSRLVVVHTGPLPEALAAVAAGQSSPSA